MSPDQQVRLIDRLYPLLRQNGLPIGIAATDDNDERHAEATVKAYPRAVRAKLALIASHTYSANASEALRRLAVKTGKPLWISEYGDGGADGLTMARRIRNDIAETHASAWIYWQFAEPDSNWGLVQYHSRETNPSFSFNRKFYVLSQFSRFIEPGNQIIDSGDDDSLAAYDPRLHRLIIVGVNDRDALAAKHFDLSTFASTGTSAEVWRTSASEDFSNSAPVPVIHQQLSVTLPAKSVTTWVIHGMVASS